jgi:DNA polymerase V
MSQNESEANLTGFPSPAQDFAEYPLSLDRHLISHKEATFFWRARGQSMHDVGIFDGDLLIVDRAVLPKDGDVVIAEVAGGFLIRRYFLQDGQGMLLTDDPVDAPIPLGMGAIWGTVIYCIHHPHFWRQE